MTDVYHYTQCGLDNVIIEDVKMVVDDAGEEVVCIPNVKSLHKEIARIIITRDQGMSPQELRFLRTEIGFTQDEIAEMLGVTRLTIGRWERGEVPLDRQAEVLIRMLAAEKLGINADATVEEMVGWCVVKAEANPIRIDGSDPNNYREAA